MTLIDGVKCNESNFQCFGDNNNLNTNFCLNSLLNI